jgi:Antidote-toxin recognition MazE, bacterial antitoxin
MNNGRYIMIEIKLMKCGMSESSGPRSLSYEGTLVKWGSSIGLAIPKPVRDGMKLKAGDKIRMVLRDNMICIQKVK